MPQGRTIYLDQAVLQLRSEQTSSGATIAAYDAADVRVSPIYQICGIENLVPALPSDALPVESLMDFIEGELRRFHLIAIADEQDG